MLRKQVPAGLNYTMTGCPNVNTDIGGFFCSSYNTQGAGSAPRNPQYQELYVRWMQYGLFCPVFRSHGADAPREIYQFGKKGEPIYDAIEQTIRLRYRLLPYIYSTAWQVTSAGESYLVPCTTSSLPQEGGQCEELCPVVRFCRPCPCPISEEKLFNKRDGRWDKKDKEAEKG